MTPTPSEATPPAMEPVWCTCGTRVKHLPCELEYGLAVAARAAMNLLSAGTKEHAALRAILDPSPPIPSPVEPDRPKESLDLEAARRDSVNPHRGSLGWMEYAGRQHEAVLALGAEVERLRAALEWAHPAEDGFSEAFDGLCERGLLVSVPSDEAFRAEWGDDADLMWVWSWSPLAAQALDESTQPKEQEARDAE